MSTANSSENNCQEGVCESNFKPVRQARPTLENLKNMAGEILTKVKETLTGEHDVILTEADEAAERRLARMQQAVSETGVSTAPSDGHCSMHSAEIIERFRQNNWNPQAGTYQLVEKETGFKVIGGKNGPSSSQLKAGRYDNPWRYDNRH